MDSIFRKCHSWFTLVKIARDEPRRFGKKGELLINNETEEHARTASVVLTDLPEKAKATAVESREHVNSVYLPENGYYARGGPQLGTV